MTSRKNVWLWVLYDFANSIVTIVFFLYFAQWVVVDRGVQDIYFNLTFTFSALALLFTVPITGYLLDKYWRRITGLRITTSSAILLYSLCAVFAVNNMEVAALIAYGCALYVYLLTFTFYTPLINDIAEPGKRGKVSGLGIMANYAGQITGLLIVLPFATGVFNWFGGAARAETLIPSVALFAILASPMLIWFQEPKRTVQGKPALSDLKELFLKSKAVILYPGVGFFMLAYFLFNDAILTAANNFPIFLAQVWGVSDTVKTFIMLGILVTSALGGIISGLVADRYGHKRTLMFILTGWVFILPAVGLATNFVFFCILTTFMGFWFGANWAVSRSVMSYLVPKEGYNLAFAYFGLVERALSFVGPIVWGLVLKELVHLGSVRYRFATLAVSIFIVLGLFALAKVRSDKKTV